MYICMYVFNRIHDSMQIGDIALACAFVAYCGPFNQVQPNLT